MKKNQKPREVLTAKVALERLALVEADVATGDISARAACRKHKFPIYKYSYWKEKKKEIEMLKSPSPEFVHGDKVEVLHDSSPLVEYEETIETLKGEVDYLAKRVAQLENENELFKDKIISNFINS